MSVAGSPLDAAERALRRVGGAAAPFALVAALVGIARGRRRRLGSAGEPDVGGAIALVATTAGFVAASAILWRPIPITLALPAARALVVATGATGLLGGLGLYLAGMAALGPAYDVSSTFGARLHDGQRLVTSGPYSVVRHPMYLGLTIAAVGASLLYRTWTALAYVVSLPVLVVRARREDEVLAAAFGAAWEAYRDQVPGWFPRLRE